MPVWIYIVHITFVHLKMHLHLDTGTDGSSNTEEMRLVDETMQHSCHLELLLVLKPLKNRVEEISYQCPFKCVPAWTLLQKDTFLSVSLQDT